MDTGTFQSIWWYIKHCHSEIANSRLSIACGKCLFAAMNVRLNFDNRIKKLAEGAKTYKIHNSIIINSQCIIINS
jgi:hypothetical protein